MMSGAKWIGRLALFAVALFLVDSLALSTPEAQAKAVAPLSVKHFGTFASVPATGEDRDSVCAICGRHVCPVPNDLVGSATPCSAIVPSGTAHSPGRNFVRLPMSRAPDIRVPLLHASFKPRGPPLLD